MCAFQPVFVLCCFLFFFWQNSCSDISTCKQFLWPWNASVCVVGTNLHNVSVSESQVCQEPKKRWSVTDRCYRYSCSFIYYTLSLHSHGKGYEVCKNLHAITTTLHIWFSPQLLNAATEVCLQLTVQAKVQYMYYAEYPHRYSATRLNSLY